MANTFPIFFLLWGTNITNVSSVLSIIFPPILLPLSSHIYHFKQNSCPITSVFLDALLPP